MEGHGQKAKQRQAKTGTQIKLRPVLAKIG
jgi:hypothetical protein